MASFRLNGKYLFLTYPKCGMVEAEMISLLESKLKDLEWLVIGAEQHKDGDPHRHVFVALSSACDLHRPTCLDLGDFHGNYQVARSPKQSLEYVMKERVLTFVGVKDRDDALARFDRGKKRPSVWAAMDAQIRLGKTAKQIVLGMPGSIQHIQKLEYAESKFLLWNMPKAPGVDRVEFSDLSNSVIAGWLMQNVRGVPRPFKQKQLYVSGAPGVGKTSLLSALSLCLNVFVAPNDGQWWDGYSDDYDLVVFDEFKGNYRIQFLNGFVEGAPHGVAVPRRGTAPYLKKKNVPVIFMSNYTLDEAYSEMVQKSGGLDRLETLRGRLTCVDLGSDLLRVKVIAKSVVPVVGMGLCASEEENDEVILGTEEQLSSSLELFKSD